VRLLLVTNDYPPKAGGIQQYLAGLMGAFGGSVRVLAPRDGPGPGDVVRDPRRFMWPTRRVRRWVESQIEAFRPDLVLFGAPHPLALMGPRLRRDTGVPYGVVCHGAEVTIPAAIPGMRQVLRRPLRRADVLFAVSRFTQAKVERLTRRGVERIGAGVGPEFTPPPRPPEGPIRVGCISRFVPRKGHDRVLRACARLVAEGHDVEAVMVGRGRRERRLRRLADRLDVSATFEVGLSFGELPDAYRRLHVFAMPCHSRWFGLEAEGFGVVFLEAAATGLPVVAGDSGGAPETVEPGSTGYVVADEDMLLDALRRLVADPELRASLGVAGAVRVRNSYSWEAVASRFEAGLQRVVSGR